MSFIGPLLSGLGSGAAGALLSRTTGTKPQQRPQFQRQLIDQLLEGLEGQGPLADLFRADPEAFRTSVTDPLLQEFGQRTAPQIQQRFISEGQQRGTPLESALTKAGTDVQSEINRQFLPFQQQAQQNQIQAINQLLGLSQPDQGQPGISPLQGAAAGFAGSRGLQDFITQLTTTFGEGAKASPGATTSQGFQGGAAQDQSFQAAPQAGRLPGFLEF